MASQTLPFVVSSAQSHQGNTSTYLVSAPLMSLAQLRIPLGVDACDECNAEGVIYTRGYDGENVTEERCPVCKGKRYIESEGVQSRGPEVA